jgi:RNA polymerase sigma-70 factor (ECF subfamily)
MTLRLPRRRPANTARRAAARRGRAGGSSSSSRARPAIRRTCAAGSKSAYFAASAFAAAAWRPVEADARSNRVRQLFYVVMEDPTPTPDGSTRDWAGALRHHARWLRRVVQGRVGDAQAVDEVMQEVSLAAVVARPAPAAGPENLAAWLYRVAVRQSLLYRRKMGRRRRLMDAVARRSSSIDPRDGSSSDPLRWLLSAERDELVRRAVAMLPGRDADVLVLKYTEHWSYRQIARHLGLSESAVEARLHRARRRLRDELARLDLNEDQS